MCVCGVIQDPGRRIVPRGGDKIKKNPINHQANDTDGLFVDRLCPCAIEPSDAQFETHLRLHVMAVAPKEASVFVWDESSIFAPAAEPSVGAV
jgi:hypothetical protein